MTDYGIDRIEVAKEIDDGAAANLTIKAAAGFRRTDQAHRAGRAD